MKFRISALASGWTGLACTCVGVTGCNGGMGPSDLRCQPLASKVAVLILQRAARAESSSTSSSRVHFHDLIGGGFVV